MGAPLPSGRSSQRVVGLLAFFATPIPLLVLSTYSLVPLFAFIALGVSLLFLERSRTAGVGILIGTAATVGAVLLFIGMFAGAD